MQNAQQQEQFDIGLVLGTQLYQSSLESPPWRTFLRELRKNFASDVTPLPLSKAGTAGPLAVADFHPSLAPAQPQPFLSLLAAAGRVFEHAADGRGMMVFADTPELRPESARVVLRGLGMEEMMGMMIAPCGLPIFLGLFRRVGAGRFMHKQVQHLSTTRPHLDQAMRGYLRNNSGLGMSRQVELLGLEIKSAAVLVR